MYFKIYRDCDSKRLRKIVIELWHNNVMLDRRRSFSRLRMKRLAKVLARKKRRMEKLGKEFLAAMGKKVK